MDRAAKGLHFHCFMFQHLRCTSRKFDSDVRTAIMVYFRKNQNNLF